jgi:Fur family ferric uptake transcriptional regulator
VSKNTGDDLRETGLKSTGPRRKILELFRIQTGHLSAEEVHSLLNAEDDIGLATVYRVLSDFEQAQIINRLHFESGKSVYELNRGEHHDHLVCLDCGHVEEFVDSQIERRQQKIANAHGFDLVDHALSLYASCRKGEHCPNRKSTER